MTVHACARADFTDHIVSYGYSWAVFNLVKKFGAQWVVTILLIPQVLLVTLAYPMSNNLGVFFVVIVSFTQITITAMVASTIYHVVTHDLDTRVC